MSRSTIALPERRFCACSVTSGCVSPVGKRSPALYFKYELVSVWVKVVESGFLTPALAWFCTTTTFFANAFPSWGVDTSAADMSAPAIPHTTRSEEVHRIGHFTALLTFAFCLFTLPLRGRRKGVGL